jgi:hypothetical protein
MLTQKKESGNVAGNVVISVVGQDWVTDSGLGKGDGTHGRRWILQG